MTVVALWGGTFSDFRRTDEYGFGNAGLSPKSVDRTDIGVFASTRLAPESVERGLTVSLRAIAGDGMSASTSPAVTYRRLLPFLLREFMAEL